MAEKWERLTEIRDRQRERDGVEEHSVGLVKKIKWVRMREKSKHLAKSNKALSLHFNNRNTMKT